MAEVLLKFLDSILSADGVEYHAQACGEAVAGGLWEACIAFVPIQGGPVVRTGRETTQPNRTDAEYWATGLTPVYLEGALQRALKPTAAELTTRTKYAFAPPAPDSIVTDTRSRGEAVLDPFSTLRKGERLLRQELGALSPRHLVDIITAYDLSTASATSLTKLPRGALVDLIVTSVREHALRG